MDIKQKREEIDSVIDNVISLCQSDLEEYFIEYGKCGDTKPDAYRKSLKKRLDILGVRIVDEEMESPECPYDENAHWYILGVKARAFREGQQSMADYYKTYSLQAVQKLSLAKENIDNRTKKGLKSLEESLRKKETNVK